MGNIARLFKKKEPVHVPAPGTFRARDEEDVKIVSEELDRDWYYAENPDVKNAGVDAALHYVRFGWKEGRNPSCFFDTSWYLKEYSDEIREGENPFVHYLREGRHRGNSPSPRHIKPVVQAHPEEFTLPGDDELEGELEPEVSDVDLESLRHMVSTAKPSAVTVDIWDTVLRRACHPDETKYQSARFLYVNYYYQVKPAFRTVGALYKARRKSEDSVSMTADFEYRFTDAVDKWLDVVIDPITPGSVREAIRTSLLDHEIKCELRVISPDENMVGFLREQGAPAFFASDFYLGKEAIQTFLRKKGISDCFIGGYVSSDYAKTKRSGDLFDLILEELSASPESVVHIGDNAHADHAVPVKKGFNAYHYVSKSHVERSDWYGKAFYSLLEGKRGAHWKRIVALAFAGKTLDGDSSSEQDLYSLGRRLAPMVVGFVLMIVEQAKRFDVDEVFFFTREGVFLKEVYDAVVEADPYLTTYPKSKILEVSRLATFLPSLREITTVEMMRLWNQYSIQSPKAFCASLDLPEDEFRPYFEEKEIAFDTPIEYPWEDERIISLFEDKEFTGRIAEEVTERRASIEAYLKSVGFLDRSPVKLTVDIGWRGTIQDNLSYLTSSHVHGLYLGLNHFLNPQPANSSKTGWLFDEPEGRAEYMPEEVAPLEMLFNSLGGSVSGYAMDSNGVTHAVRSPIDGEEIVHRRYVRPIQEGMVDAASDIARYVGIHGLHSQDLQGLGVHLVKELLKSPPPTFCDAFFGLEHNETFGAGEVETLGSFDDTLTGLKDLDGSRIHASVQSLLNGTRWVDGLLNLPRVKTALSSLSDRQKLHLPSKAFLSLDEIDSVAGKVVGFFVPAPLVGSGGHRTIFNLARKFHEFGCELYIFLEQEGAGISVVEDYLAGADAHIFTQWHKHIPLDIAVATIAHSARFVASLELSKEKFYLIQDFEAMFNPVGDGFHLAEQSYIYPTHNLTVGNWLTHVLREEFSATATPAGLGVDTNVYHVENEIDKEDAICFLYQPEKARRCPQLAIHALRLVKIERPDVKIYVYGSDAPVDLDFEHENLGLIHDLSELNALYNRCKIGLCISMSNPSRIPFELMASGAVPVDVYRYNNLLDYPSGTALLAYQGEASLAAAMLQLLEDEALFEERRVACREFVRSRSLSWEMEVFFNQAANVLINGVELASATANYYADKPVIAEADVSEKVKAFTEFQRRKAGIEIDGFSADENKKELI